MSANPTLPTVTPSLFPAIWPDGNLVFVTTAHHPTMGRGALVALDRETGQPRWTKKMRGYAWGSPVVVDGVMYLTGPQSQVYALDAGTGQELWTYVPELTDIAALPLCCGQVNRGVAVAEGKVFVGQLDAKLTALDQKTGAVVWSVQVDDPRAGYSETMAPVYYDGLAERQSYVAAFELIATHGAPGEYEFPLEGGRTCRIHVAHDVPQSDATAI